MAVKEGLPATDFSKMNRDYIRNVAEGETVKDGLPATDFSRMNREYIKAVVEESGGGGGSITVEELNVTENNTYTAPEGKAYSPVIVNVSGGGSSDFTTFDVEIVNNYSADILVQMPIAIEREGIYFSMPSIQVAENTTVTVQVIAYKGTCLAVISGVNFTVSPNTIEVSGETVIITDDCTITLSQS